MCEVLKSGVNMVLEMRDIISLLKWRTTYAVNEIETKAESALKGIRGFNFKFYPTSKFRVVFNPIYCGKWGVCGFETKIMKGMEVLNSEEFIIYDIKVAEWIIEKLLWFELNENNNDKE